VKVSDDTEVIEARRLRLPLTPSRPRRLPSVAFHLSPWRAERRPEFLHKGSISARAA